MRELPHETVIVFVSDCHVGGDPGCDSFEVSEELGSLFKELAMHGRPLELVLAEDFFDLLLISNPPEGRRAAGRRLGASEARRSTPDEAREAGEPGQDTPNLRGRQTARDRRLRDSRMKVFLALEVEMRHLISPPMAVGRAGYPVPGEAARPFRGLRLALLRPSRRVFAEAAGGTSGVGFLRTSNRGGK